MRRNFGNTALISHSSKLLKTEIRVVLNRLCCQWYGCWHPFPTIYHGGFPWRTLDLLRYQVNLTCHLRLTPGSKYWLQDPSILNRPSSDWMKICQEHRIRNERTWQLEDVDGCIGTWYLGGMRSLPGPRMTLHHQIIYTLIPWPTSITQPSPNTNSILMLLPPPLVSPLA
jgi:hypothetical protein